MQSSEVRERFLKFFEARGHKILPSSSLVPENDPTVHFTTAGMQQFKGYYTAPEQAVKDFGTKNVATSQKCVRTGDVEEVGDDTHLTFLEMLGNFSFGGYGKEEAIRYGHEFITKELGLKISYVTFYKGEGVVPKDEESKKIWEKLGVQDIREDGADVFWGPTGDSGPCGPTTEIYCKNAKGDDVETWNIVFNEYFCNGSREKLDKGEAQLTKLPVFGIDTGMGFERLLASVQNKKSVFDTDLFSEVMLNVGQSDNEKSRRVVADHLRTVVFMIADGVLPDKDERGYVPRRLIRLAMSARYLFIDKSLDKDIFLNVINAVIDTYKESYPYLNSRREEIIKIIEGEVEKFSLILINTVGDLKKIYNRFISVDPEKNNNVVVQNNTMELNGEVLFRIRETHGVGLQIMKMVMEKWGFKFSDKTLQQYDQAYEKARKLSQTSSVGMFKGGLANHDEKTIQLHTAHHLLLAGLQVIVDKNIKQRGSNITEERLRMDFSFGRKLTDEEKKKVEEWVNEKIKLGLDVVRREMPLVEAEKLGAEMEFGAKYPEIVSLYFIEDKDGNPLSKEFCGGPHVNNTEELGTFKILKEEAVSSGVRRIKAVLS